MASVSDKCLSDGKVPPPPPHPLFLLDVWFLEWFDLLTLLVSPILLMAEKAPFAGSYFQVSWFKTGAIAFPMETCSQTIEIEVIQNTLKC